MSFKIIIYDQDEIENTAFNDYIFLFSFNNLHKMYCTAYINIVVYLSLFFILVYYISQFLKYMNIKAMLVDVTEAR